MMRRLWVSLAVVALVPLTAAAATINVTVANFSFTPKDVTIGLHDTVHWTMPSASFHTVTNGAGSGSSHAINSSGRSGSVVWRASSWSISWGPIAA